MSRCSIQARQPVGDPDGLRFVRDADRLRPYLEDAAHFPGGHAPALVAPATEAEVAAALAATTALLPIGAQSSLTGGGTPMGEVLLSTARMNRIESIGSDIVRVQAGVTVSALDEALARAGRYYPPAPTFTGAFVGGTVATNAAGAATFKYGTTRDWVQALTIVLPEGDVLDVRRGETRAHAAGYFELQLAARAAYVPIPRYRMPDVPKLSAGYFAEPEMDLIDLFIGSEGTLGIITDVTLRVVSERPAFCLAFVPLAGRARGLSLVDRLRRAAMDTRRTSDARGIDVSGIEHMDERCLALLREDGVDRANGVTIPDDATLALLVALELPPGVGAAQAFDEIGRARDGAAPDTPLVRFCAILDEAGARADGNRRAGRSCARRAAARREGGRAGGCQRPHRTGAADRRSTHRENGRGHDRALRALRGPARFLRPRASPPRSRCRGLGSCF